MDEIQTKIEPLAKRIIENTGMELIELKVAGHKNDLRLQIIADKSSGGISMRECAILNKALVAAIEQENVLPPETFSLELSSPGLDRPLVTRKDFMRAVSRKLHFWLNEALGGKKEVEGLLVEVKEKDLIVEIKGEDRLVIPFSSINKGMLVI